MIEGLPDPSRLSGDTPCLAGRYLLVGRVGRGGMADVCAAWDLRREEWCAAKVLLPRHARDRSVRVRFLKEAETMASLDHPNLVRVTDPGDGGELPFMVMELVTGGSLDGWCASHGPMPPRMAVDVALQVCAGLSAIHRAGVVHRDVKPRNLLISEGGVVKVTDFGIAQLEQSQETRTGLAMGTMGFMSPEQLHDAKSVDLRSDLYAAGASLFTILTGRKARDLFRLEDRPELMDGVPEVLRSVLARCLAYERTERYPSADELAAALREARTQLPEDPGTTPPLFDARGPLRLDLDLDPSYSELFTTAARATAGPTAPEPRSLYAEEQPQGLRPEVIGLPKPPSVARSRRGAGWLLAVALAAPLVLGVVALVGGAAGVGYGAWSVGAARHDHLLAAADLERRVSEAEPLPDEVVALGVEPAELRAAFDDWRSAADDESRGDAARHVATLVDRQVRPAIPLSDRNHEQELVLQRVEPLLAASVEEARSRAVWKDVSEGGLGRLAVSMQLATGP